MKALVTTDHVATALEHWGDSIPAWVRALAEECTRTSQSKVAARLEVSAAMISQTLRAKYPGDLTRLEELFTGVFQAAEVPCPAKGIIPAQDCRRWRDRSRELLPVNTERVLMFRACNRCPRNAKEDQT